MRRRAFTLIELLVYGMILSVMTGSLLAVTISLTKTQQAVTSIPAALADALAATEEVAAYLRRASLCDSSAGCTGTPDSAFVKAESNAVAVFTTTAGANATFTNSNGSLIRTQNGAQATVVGDSVKMSYEYLLSTGLDYTIETSPELMTWYTSVSSSSLPAIIAVRVTATVTRDNVTSVQSTVVRLRNSPKKNYSTS